ncbi:hypothetical protein [Planctomycetes bacterium TBK1r]|uniref:Bacteriophage protein n=1 Tax=Stieleria magnilauensis TaxID=2527963 RepID=A0ABX5XSL7_9BACT|nr:hypothetical protein TBK1r_39410 [Planctomycetes bacterium TBK1r]
MATTLNQRIRMTGGTGGLSSGPVAAGIRLPHGTLCFIDSTGHRTNVIAAGANRFAGIVHSEADNAAGADGDLDVEHYIKHRFVLPFPGGITQADEGKKVYASDNWTLTLSPTNNSYVGTLEKFVDANTGQVAIDFQAV